MLESIAANPWLSVFLLFAMCVVGLTIVLSVAFAGMTVMRVYEIKNGIIRDKGKVVSKDDLHIRPGD